MSPWEKRGTYLALAVTAPLVLGLFAYVSDGIGLLDQTPTSSSASYESGSVTNSSGADVCCHYSGSDPTPAGCKSLLGPPTVSQGCSLGIYASSHTVQAGGDALCITPVLEYVNGTAMTYGVRDGVSMNFNVTDPNGKTVFEDGCFYTPPPSFAPEFNKTEDVWGCTGVWYTTGAAPGGGLSPTRLSPLQVGTLRKVAQ